MVVLYWLPEFQTDGKTKTNFFSPVTVTSEFCPNLNPKGLFDLEVFYSVMRSWVHPASSRIAVNRHCLKLPFSRCTSAWTGFSASVIFIPGESPLRPWAPSNCSPPRLPIPKGDIPVSHHKSIISPKPFPLLSPLLTQCTIFYLSAQSSSCFTISAVFPRGNELCDVSNCFSLFSAVPTHTHAFSCHLHHSWHK